MKTRLEILEQIEILWDYCQNRNKGINEAELDFKESVTDVIINHNKQCCDEQIKACAENATATFYIENNVKFFGVNKDSILTTPNVVTTK